MAHYVPKNWIPGETITADALNHIEKGIETIELIPGPQGPQGLQGKQGPTGPAGKNGVAVATEGNYAFNINSSGHLILVYSGSVAPGFSIDSNGHLIWEV